MYTNRFTRANPGLLIFMVDQSYSMIDPWTEGKSKAEMTALVINNCISELIQRTTDIKVGVKDEVRIVIIGYGGIEKSDEAYVIASKTNKEFSETPLQIEKMKQKISNGAGGLVEIEVEKAVWLEPKAVWNTPMAHAFEMAYKIIDGWVTKKQNREITPDAKVGNPNQDPVPIVINVTDGMPTDDENVTRNNAAKVKSIVCPDGNPLIFNVHISEGSGNEIKFPTERPSDEASSLMYDISSELPDAFVGDAKTNGFDVKGGEKTFISNCSKVETFIGMLNLGTQVGQKNQQ